MKRRKNSIPVMLLWTKRDQQRFIEAVERLCSAINDLERVLEPAKRRRGIKTALVNGVAQLQRDQREMVRLALAELDLGLNASAMPREHMQTAFKILVTLNSLMPSDKPAAGGDS